MKSAKCPGCGFVGWADAEFCKKCGAPVVPSATELSIPSQQIGPAAQNPNENQTYYYPPNVNPFPEDLKNGWAITSLVSGILNFLLLGILVLPTIAGMVISVVALKKINRHPFAYGGKGMAVGGLVLNIVSAVALIPILLIAAIAIPNLLAARRAANEGQAIVSLRRFHNAEGTYYVRYRKYGTLTELQQMELISPDLASGTRSGYRFQIEILSDRGDGYPGFTVVAVPTEYGSTGRRSFFVDYTGVIRAADSHGMEATKYDPPLNFGRENASLRDSQSLSDQ